MYMNVYRIVKFDVLYYNIFTSCPRCVLVFRVSDFLTQFILRPFFFTLNI